MIKLSGNAPDLDTLLASYPADSVERQVLQQMSDGNDTYKYDDEGLVRFELGLRSAIVAASYALNDSRLSFAVFNKARCNEQYWLLTDNGGFSLQPSARASEAIRDIYTNGGAYATECATAMVIVYYKALLEVYGDELFDALFENIYLMNWSVPEPLLREVGTPKKAGDHLLGDRVYFKNPDVDARVPWWQGENVIVLPDSLYYGHGVGILDADAIIGHLNSQRTEGSTTSAYLMDTAGRPSFKKLYRAGRAQPAMPASATSSEVVAASATASEVVAASATLSEAAPARPDAVTIPLAPMPEPERTPLPIRLVWSFPPSGTRRT